MSSQNKFNNSPILEDKFTENVALHRTESMVNEKVDMPDQVNNTVPDKVQMTVHAYVASRARSFGSTLIDFSVEILMFIYMFSYILRSISSTTMIMEKVCLVHLKYEEDICRNLKDHENIKTEVEKMANNYTLAHSFIQMMPSAILSVFVGTWSDKYSRRIPIIFALVGIILDGFGATLCAYFIRSRVEYYFIPALFTGLSGGFVSALTVLYSYASDVTSSDKRTMKYAVLEAAFGISMPLGAVAGGWIYKYSGYIPVFLVSTCGHILGLFWVFYFLKETRGLDNTDTWRQKFFNFWSVGSLVSAFKATAKRRPNKGNIQIWLMVLSMSLAVFSFASLAGISFFYVHHRYNWENTTYSTVSAVYSVIGLTVMLIIVPLFRRFNIGDPVIGIIGSLSVMLRNIVMGLASKVWIYHLSCVFGLFMSLANLAGRTIISKVVSKDDLGKVFSFLSACESIFPIAASIIVSQAYNATLEIFPGLVHVVMGSIIVINVSAFVWIARLPKANYEEMDENVGPENTEIKSEELSPAKY